MLKYQIHMTLLVRVEHIFMVQAEGNKRRKKLVYTGTITGIVKEARNPLYTLLGFSMM